jgi:hypothetical protein
MTDSSSPSTASRSPRLALLALLSFSAAVVTGCPGSLQDPERFLDGAAGSCPDVQATIISGTCAASGCHSAADKQQGLDLQSPGVASRLVNVPATEGTGLLIDPNAPQGSILYKKITATPPFGARMPFGQTPLDAATIACVLDWITAQVQADGGSDSSVASDDGSEPPPGDDATTTPPPSDASGTMTGMDATTTTPKDAGSDAHVKRDSGTTMDATSSQPEAAAPDDASDDAATD